MTEKTKKFEILTIYSAAIWGIIARCCEKGGKNQDTKHFHIYDGERDYSDEWDISVGDKINAYYCPTEGGHIITSVEKKDD